MYNFHTLFLGQQVKHLPSCHSTNSIALELIEAGQAQEGLLVLSDYQSAGRGQGQNIWEAAPFQNITLSLVLTPRFLAAQEQFYLSMAVALSLHDSLRAYVPDPDGLKVKWPNDIFYEDKKICGILIQNLLKNQHLHYAIVGVGINVNQTQFQSVQASSLKLINGQQNNLTELTEAFLKAMEVRYLQLRHCKYDRLRFDYLQQLYAYQEARRFEVQGRVFEGKILGVDSVGKICIETEGQLHYFQNKEVALLPKS